MTQEESWEKTGRNTMDVLFHLKGQGDSKLVLNPTHEEVVTPLVAKYTFSYNDLPVAVYQIQNKFRNEARAKSGLLRGREFNMKDLYSFHTDEADLSRYYEIVKKAYFAIYQRLGLGDKTVLTFSSGGPFSQFSHEFQTLCENGEDTIYLCKKCNVAVNKEIIDIQKTCPECGNDKLDAVKAIEVGNIFKLGIKFSRAFKFNYSDKNGQEKLVEMGCYGIGPSRIMGTIVETFNDEKGIIWPKSVTPYQVHLVGLDLTDETISKSVNDLYEKLKSLNIDVLFDDRADNSAGEKFAVADLLGIPIRIVASKRSLSQNGFEYKLRTEKEIEVLGTDQLVEKILAFYKN